MASPAGTNYLEKLEEKGEALSAPSKLSSPSSTTAANTADSSLRGTSPTNSTATSTSIVDHFLDKNIFVSVTSTMDALEASLSANGLLKANDTASSPPGDSFSYNKRVPVQEDPAFRVDPYGFITNLDKEGHFVMDDYEEPDSIKVPTFVEAQQNTRRIEKWNAMLASWKLYTNKRFRKFKQRARKGIPTANIRTKVWKRVAGVQAKMNQHPGLYASLVQQSCLHSNSTSVRSLQDTIERDIHRTFPRHILFYDRRMHESNANAIDCLKGLAFAQDDVETVRGDDASTTKDILYAENGQASLRRILKAYSMYDPEIGYCQGMNFIVGMMLITNFTEEESFWLLVYTMKEEPCRIGDLFGEGMKQTHEVLYVAERLIHQFLPKLSKHFDREHIQINMFVTQWLLTQYSSSFHFDFVIRVWDAFLVEGWKITYRVMLAILEQVQSDLLSLSFEEILVYVRDIPDHVRGRAVLERAVQIPLKTSHIRKYEKEWSTKQDKH